MLRLWDAWQGGEREAQAQALRRGSWAHPIEGEGGILTELGLARDLQRGRPLHVQRDRQLVGAHLVVHVPPHRLLHLRVLRC